MGTATARRTYHDGKCVARKSGETMMLPGSFEVDRPIVELAAIGLFIATIGLCWWEAAEFIVVNWML